jgi:SLIT-ROBO Rho GTPase activating protein
MCPLLPKNLLYCVGDVYIISVVSDSLSEYSDENMMDPYNLAICFGPTLLPIPPDRDQVSYQASVNEIIKTIIVHQEEIFPNDGGEVYEKCILENRFVWKNISFI